MAKTIQSVRVTLFSSDTTFDQSTATVEYRIVDGDLSKRSRLVVSGVDTAVSDVEDYWDNIIDEINIMEGLV